MNLQYIHGQFQFMIRSIFCQYQSRSYVLLKIPPEIVGIILALLPIPDQICFSLSCKYLYECFCFILEARGIRLPWLIPPEKRPILCSRPNIEQRPRIQLLRQLENSRWRYCSECWRLHPRSAWHNPRSIRFLSLKMHNSPYQPLDSRGCMPYAGEVDICPCLTITFLDKLRLIETIKSARQRDPNERQYYYTNMLYHPSAGRLRKYLGHSCMFMNHPLAKVPIRTSLWLEGGTQNLCVTNCYHFKVLQESSNKTPLIGPQKDKDFAKWLTQFFDEAGLTLSGWHEDGYFSLPSCELRIVKPNNEPDFFQIEVVRYLGNGEWPDRMWNLNRRT